VQFAVLFGELIECSDW